jgi:predicted small secreted protein
MSLIKDTVIEAIRRMPEDVTIKDIVKEIISIGIVLESLGSEGETISTDEVLKKVDECKKNEKFNQKIETIYLTLKKESDKMWEELSKIKYYGDVRCSKCGSTDIFPCYIEKKDEGEDVTFQCH